MTDHPLEQDRLRFNGVDGTTGEYLFPALSRAELSRLARQADSAGTQLRQLRAWNQLTKQRTLGPRHGVDPRRLEQAGWGVVFAEDADPDIREALEPLLTLRRRQAGRRKAYRYRELMGDLGYRRDESKVRFLARHGVGSGPADPDRLPYYLLLVGSPEAIPYDFQYSLDVQYAVGRLCFDTVEEYAHYARSVVAAEEGAFARPRQATFFGVRQPGDLATEMVHDLLVNPLARQLARGARRWDVRTACGPDATKERLGRLLGGSETPALLFTGSHGVGFRRGSSRQRSHQGALVCQPVSEQAAVGPCFSADDVPDSACPGGLIAFAFACYSAGTPHSDSFADPGAAEPVEISDQPFVARLPQRLLGHPRGGALAVVGHVDRAWSYSFWWPLAEAQTEVFASVLRRLLAGYPLGSAMEFLNQRYSELECDLADLRQRLDLCGQPDLLELEGLWTARNDARNFVVLGDPAVRLVPARGDGSAGAAA